MIVVVASTLIAVNITMLIVSVIMFCFTVSFVMMAIVITASLSS